MHWFPLTVPVALLYTCRILGLFLLIPVFTVFAPQLHGATPQLTGVALGAYGLAQACMQIPFGLLSDRVGRTRMLYIGLALLAIGSLLGAYTTSIYGMIMARSLQGAGAIGSVLLALLTDRVPAQHRAKSMAVIGVSMGLSFSLAMMLSPVLTHLFGMASIFHLTVILALLGIGIVYRVLPSTSTSHPTACFQPNTLRQAVFDPGLQPLYAGIFIQHHLLTATFFILPLQLQIFIQQHLLDNTWHFYLPMILGAFLLMAPLIVIIEKKQCIQTGLFCAILTLAGTQGLLAYYHVHWIALMILFFLYFVAFNLCEAFLPTQVSQLAPSQHRGTVMGIYSSAQFLGIFSGGLLAGYLATHGGASYIYASNAGLAVLWGLLLLSSIRKNY